MVGNITHLSPGLRGLRDVTTHYTLARSLTCLFTTTIIIIIIMTSTICWLYYIPIILYHISIVYLFTIVFY